MITEDLTIYQTSLDGVWASHDRPHGFLPEDAKEITLHPDGTWTAKQE